MKRNCRIECFVLAGGASSRMGRDKAMLDVGGEPLIARTARLVRPLVSALTIVGSPERYADLGIRTIPDAARFVDTARTSEMRGLGPLAGIATALGGTNAQWNLMLACDLPYLSRSWIEWLISRALRSEAQIVIPRTARGLESLAAIYHRDCRPMIEAALASGVRKVTDAVAGLRREEISYREWKHLDPHGRVLNNMNLPQEYSEAREWGEKSRNS